MNIGILTFHLGPNHGGFLQAHWLCETIRKMGHQVEIINYKNPTHYRNEQVRFWKYRRPSRLYYAWIKQRVFQKAYQTLPLSDFADDVRKVDWNRYDAVVIGSDVVWDYEWDWLGRDRVYFGDFGGEYSGKVIAYAPSVGTVRPEAKIPEWVATGLAGMDAVSARDDTTAGIVKRACGRDAPIVVDPTWLDIGYTENSTAKEPYLLVYAHQLNPEMQRAIVAYARSRALRIIAIGYAYPWADENLMKLAPLEFKGYIRRAQAMVAGTFHGALYAIKSQCQFAVVLSDHILPRVSKALELSGLTSRGLTRAEDLAELMNERIDFKQVMTRLEPHVARSRQYLLTHLGSLA